MRIADCTIDEHFILDRDRMQIARPHANEGEGRRIIRDSFERPTVAVLVRCEQVKMRRKQKSLPRLKTDSASKVICRVRSQQTGTSGSLLEHAPYGQVGNISNSVKNYGAITHGWTD
jgi:hypothetical protein